MKIGNETGKGRFTVDSGGECAKCELFQHQGKEVYRLFPVQMKKKC